VFLKAKRLTNIRTGTFLTSEGEYAENVQHNGEKGQFIHIKNTLAPTALSEQRFLSAKNGSGSTVIIQ
jgi:hypothetical protein